MANLEFEESQTPSYHFPNYLDLQLKLKKKGSDFPELSDWTSNFDLPRASLSVKEHKKGGLSAGGKDEKRMTFFNTTRYPSSLLTPNKQGSRL